MSYAYGEGTRPLSPLSRMGMVDRDAWAAREEQYALDAQRHPEQIMASQQVHADHLNQVLGRFHAIAGDAALDTLGMLRDGLPGLTRFATTLGVRNDHPDSVDAETCLLHLAVVLNGWSGVQHLRDEIDDTHRRMRRDHRLHAIEDQVASRYRNDPDEWRAWGVARGPFRKRKKSYAKELGTASISRLYSLRTAQGRFVNNCSFNRYTIVQKTEKIVR